MNQDSPIRIIPTHTGLTPRQRALHAFIFLPLPNRLLMHTFLKLDLVLSQNDIRAPRAAFSRPRLGHWNAISRPTIFVLEVLFQMDLNCRFGAVCAWSACSNRCTKKSSIPARWAELFGIIFAYSIAPHQPINPSLWYMRSTLT